MKAVHWLTVSLTDLKLSVLGINHVLTRTGEVIEPPASEPEPAYEVKVDGNSILIRKRSDSVSSQLQKEQKPQLELTLKEKQKVEGTNVMSFKFDKSSLQYAAGQYAYFDIGGVHDDPKGPIRHFTIASSPTENFILMTKPSSNTMRGSMRASIDSKGVTYYKNG